MLFLNPTLTKWEGSHRSLRDDNRIPAAHGKGATHMMPMAPDRLGRETVD